MTFRIDSSTAGGAEVRKAEELMAKVAELRKARQSGEAHKAGESGADAPAKPLDAENPNEVAAFLERLPDTAGQGQDHHQLSPAKVAALLDLV